MSKINAELGVCGEGLVLAFDRVKAVLQCVGDVFASEEQLNNADEDLAKSTSHDVVEDEAWEDNDDKGGKDDDGSDNSNGASNGDSDGYGDDNAKAGSRV